MKRIAILTISLLLVGLAYGQKTRRSTGEFQVKLTREMSEAEACETCMRMAMVQAIEKAFGRVLVQGNTTVVENVDTGEAVETNQTFNLIAETYVNGDWIKTLNEECERFQDGEDLWVRCQVKGKVQELTQPAYDLQVSTLDCEESRCATDRFVDGEPFYLYFKSPVDGYLTVYIGDPTITQRLLPYRQMPSDLYNAVPVQADEEYILFSMRQDPFDLRGYVDEYEMYASKPVDQNRIYVVFSREPLIKPALYAGEDPKAEQAEMPLELAPEDFVRWLAKQRRYNPDIQVERLDVLITQ
jgi:hypothetical protein